MGHDRRESDSGPIEMRSPRYRLHHGIRHIFSSAVAEFYRKHPGRLTEDAEIATDGLLKIMLSVLDKVDEFEVREKVKEQDCV
jgi:hypothetical protein